MGHGMTKHDTSLTRETPWHKLSTVKGRQFTAAEALKEGKLGGWGVEKFPLYARPVKSNRVTKAPYLDVPEFYATIRTDNDMVLGVVGSDWSPIQIEELFEFAEAILDTGDADFDSAGSLRKCRVVYASLEVKRPLVVAGVEFKPFLTVATSFDNSIATRALVSPTVVVCANTLTMAIQGAKHEYKLKHTPGARDRLIEARDTLGITFGFFDKLEEEVQTLTDQDITTRKFNAIMEELFPDTESERGNNSAFQRRNEVAHILATDPAAAPWKGSAWGVFNAVNTWELWHKPIRIGTQNSIQGADDAEGYERARAERQAIEHLRGAGAPLTAKTHKLLVAARKKS